MSRSIFFAGRASAPGRAFRSFRLSGALPENALTPVGAGTPGTNGLPTMPCITTGFATGLPVFSIWTTFCANGSGRGGGTRRATTGRSGLPRGTALGPGLPPEETTRLSRLGTTPTGAKPITGARSICAASTRIGRTGCVANVL
jgi:hypothetical protein